MLKRKKILAGIFAMVVGLSVALPMSASANDDHWWDRNHHEHWDHHDAHYREWAWQRDHDHYRAYTYAPGYGYHSVNGAGMVDPRNPRLMWACDSEGHHCHWAPR
jgi:Ni/Co efflux regulator RcnB